MRCQGQPSEHDSIFRTPGSLAMLVIFWFILALPGLSIGAGQGEEDLEASILRAKPGVVLISSEVGAEVTLRCGKGEAHTLTPDPH